VRASDPAHALSRDAFSVSIDLDRGRLQTRLPRCARRRFVHQ
jgi:hypothetical protein